ncbi:MAG: dephospho-CoA kinase [Candidatus Coatesbacteria bacterium]|nr:MAG: dephospho-CoA kinase [Candidatus Coatesbacteria bacterium]
MGERPYVVGVTGSLCAGKTALTEILAGLGYPVVYADILGHYALTEPNVVEKLTDAFGDVVLGAYGKVDRKNLASVVFNDKAALRTLNEVVHPRLFELIEETLERYWPGQVILEAALLCEWGDDMPVDVLVCVDAPEDVRRARCAEKYAPEDFTARQESQLPPAEKARLAHVVINNNGTVRTLADKARKLSAIIQKRFTGSAGLGGKIIL